MERNPYNSPYDTRHEEPVPESPELLNEEARREDADGDLLVAGDRTDHDPDHNPLNTDESDHDRLDTDGLDHNPVNTDTRAETPDTETPDDALAPHAETKDDLLAPEAVTIPEQRSPADEIDFDARWHDIKAGFVDDPRDSVEKADALIDEAVTALAARRQALVDSWKNHNDTEQLRLALREYRSLFDKLKG
ncbi:hypothetical protein GCM10009555_097850 [Acrocarpospora macrocephala]|uniref:Uncharacterized protein n=1 Tax=Acrocarpospora macrocephala TaxID=150177 RepID=A0A5M3X1L5_9ACTN|nr:hypothetical protein [Acrocarpospora macrocephala]GES12633.1 hypothetical protein Amac_062300 [Acrocarpospora macrocephala]